jgi:hypothetical protein
MIKYITESGALISKKYGLLRTIKCPLQKSWEDLQRLDFDTQPDFIELDQYTERHRYCDSCRSNVMTVDGLNESEIEGACLAAPNICLHATLPHPAIEIEDNGKNIRRCPPTDTKLRIVHTARHLPAMNNAVEKGFWPLIRPVIPDETIGSKLIVWQDEYGVVHTSGDYRSGNAFKAQTYWHNPYISPLPFAAYLIPPDIKIGETVHLVDLIEDRVGRYWNQGDSWRQISADAVWTGETLEIQDSGALCFVG